VSVKDFGRTASKGASMTEETIYNEMKRSGVSRRQFLKTCGVIAASLGVGKVTFAGGNNFARAKGSSEAVTKLVANALKTKPKVPVIWLEMQSCTGCSEALTRSHSPSLADLVLNNIAVEYHETLSAASGFQVEANKQSVMKQYMGKYILVLEGSVPLADNGIYCVVGGKTMIQSLKEAASGAAAIISTGNCASFGGIPHASPNPTKAEGAWKIIGDKPIVNIPGCPAIPEVFTGVLANFLIFGTLPELDDLHRPNTFYGNTIHDRCLRRSFYEAGKFALSFDDEGARKGFCLYKLGCKGPTTYNSCATIKWDGGLSFPVQAGHPCLGCSQPNFWDGGGFYQGQSAPLSKPGIAAIGTAAAVGAALGLGLAASNNSKKKKPHKS
jgi:hydrogenase small subunit